MLGILIYLLSTYCIQGIVPDPFLLALLSLVIMLIICDTNQFYLLILILILMLALMLILIVVVILILIQILLLTLMQ